MKLQLKRLDPGLPVPRYATEGDAGLDLFSAVDVTLKPGERAAVLTGIAIALEPGHAGFVHARSGRALRDGLALVNAPGVVDAGYRGEVKVIVVNLAPDEPIYIKRGEKVAQLVIQRIEQAEIEVVEALPDSQRGTAGFGSTGA